MADGPRRNIHVPLPAEVHEGLREQARRLGTPATTLAREAIAEWVARSRREQVRDEIREYAHAAAGSAEDLDQALEVAAVEAWRVLDE